MADETPHPDRKRFSLRDVPGTTVAVGALAILAAAAVVSAPLWIWYTTKRKRTDALAAHPPTADEVPAADSKRSEPARLP